MNELPVWRRPDGVVRWPRRLHGAIDALAGLSPAHPDLRYDPGQGLLAVIEPDALALYQCLRHAVGGVDCVLLANIGGELAPAEST